MITLLDLARGLNVSPLYLLKQVVDNGGMVQFFTPLTPEVWRSLLRGLNLDGAPSYEAYYLQKVIGYIDRP